MPESERFVIADTSPLLYLHHARKVPILRALYGSVVVPAAVRAELAIGKERGHDTPDVSSIEWIQPVDIPESGCGRREHRSRGPASGARVAGQSLGAPLPPLALISLKTDREAFSKELPLLAAVKLFELGRLSSGRAAQLAGISRVVLHEARQVAVAAHG
jgi:hypothetical protein